MLEHMTSRLARLFKAHMMSCRTFDGFTGANQWITSDGSTIWGSTGWCGDCAHPTASAGHCHYGAPLVGMGVISLSTAKLSAVVSTPNGVDHCAVHGTPEVLTPRAHRGHHRPFVEFRVVAFHCTK